MGRVAVGLGGIASTLTAIGYVMALGEEPEFVVSLRPCKKGEIRDAKRVHDSLFLVNPSTHLKRGVLHESQLAAKGFKTYVVCLRDPWPMVLESVEVVLNNKRVVAGDAFCACSPLPTECYPSFEALAALDKHGEELAVLYPGRPPADPNCVAERLEKAKECYKGVKLPLLASWEKFRRLVDYVYAKAPGGVVKRFKDAIEQGVSPFYVFDLKCYYDKQEDCKALRRKGPKEFRKPKRPCAGDLMDVLSSLGVKG